MGCHTNCAVLNITSCVYNTLARQVRVGEVEYDRDGCFREAEYLRHGDKYTTFLQVNVCRFIVLSHSLIKGITLVQISYSIHIHIV